MGKLIWRSLMRNKLRTFLTISSVALALFILTLLGSVLAAMESTEGASASRIVVRNAISLTFSMPESYGPRLLQLQHVEGITPLNWYQGVYKDSRMENQFPRFGSDADTLFEVFSDLDISHEHLTAWREDRAGFVAGKALAEAQGWQLGDEIFIKGDIYPVDLQLTLRGIFSRPDAPAQERQMYFHRRYLEEAMNNPGIIGTYWLSLDSPSSVPAVVKAAEARFANSDTPVRAETEEAFALSFLEMMGNVRLLLGSIGLAIVISILFITANTMAMAARERVREVAVLRTLGFRRGQVTSLVLFESLLVGVLGALVGALIASGMLGAIGKAMEDVFPLFSTLQPTPSVLAVALGIGIAIGLVSGAVPAWNASSTSIVDGLRKVG